MSQELVPLLAGLGLLILGGGWWVLARRRRAADALLNEAFSSSDPDVRVAAVALIGKEGVRRHAEMLLELSRGETDTAVLRALAETVSQNLWEPANDPRVVELRLWAGRYLRATEPPARAERGRRSHDGDWEGEAPIVLVTGAGGAAGVAVLQALRERGVTVVGADADEMATGLRLADRSSTLPRSDDPAFIEAVVKLAVHTGAGALISTVAEEMVALNEGSDELAAAGISTWLPPAAGVRSCIDKWEFAQVVQNCGVSFPATALGLSTKVPGPWIIKPRFGRGSRDVHRVDAFAELAFMQQHVPEPIVQTRLHGMEFTVDALIDRDGSLAAAVPRWRLETKAGISSKGRTFRDEQLVAQVEKLLSVLQLTGPANVQGFVTSEDGTAVFVEVNPRFSGGLPLSLAAGADLVGEYLRGVVGMPIRRDRLRYQSGVMMTRYLESLFER